MTEKIHFTFNDDHSEIERLRARVKELEEALTKIMSEWLDYPDCNDDFNQGYARGLELCAGIANEALKGQTNAQA